jgi:hypothetical protein
LLRGTPGNRLGSGQPLGVDVVQRQGHVPQFGEREDVGEQLTSEHDTAGAEEGDHIHLRIFRLREQPDKTFLVRRAEMN